MFCSLIAWEVLVRWRYALKVDMEVIETRKKKLNTFLQEQFFIMKPAEIVTRSFKLLPTSDQAAKYMCVGME